MDLAIENQIKSDKKGVRLVAGVDEAGRGPLAGPVVAAAVVLAEGVEPLGGVGDSKALTPELREELFATLSHSPGVGIGVGVVDVETIDRINILQATLLAMERAVEALPGEFRPDYVMVDGNRLPQHLAAPAEFLIKGDSKCYSIAAASIIAKVTRDRMMGELDARHPEYGFGKHMGYGTRDHVNALHKFGALPEHRRTFNPLKTWLAQKEDAATNENKAENTAENKAENKAAQVARSDRLQKGKTPKAVAAKGAGARTSAKSPAAKQQAKPTKPRATKRKVDEASSKQTATTGPVTRSRA